MIIDSLIKPFAFTFAFTLLLAYGSAQAEKADKTKPAIIDSDKVTINEVTQTRVFEGNVLMAKGTMLISAERVELKVDAEGYQTMSATGTASKSTKFKQKREGLDETLEAESVALFFDGKADTILLTDQAIMRRMAKGVQQHEVRGALIKYSNQTGSIEVLGGPTSSDAGGRVRTVISHDQPAPAVSK
jgi:lipopolysaccharide export system protein LptA